MHVTANSKPHPHPPTPMQVIEDHLERSKSCLTRTVKELTHERARLPLYNRNQGEGNMAKCSQRVRYGKVRQLGRVNTHLSIWHQWLVEPSRV